MQNKSTVWLDELRKECLQRSARNPGVAALMSFFVMGLGQIYAGHVDRGIVLMGIHLSGILSIYSIYSGGILYETVVPVVGAGTIVIFSYFCCVVFILLWIYNIKDAYYLSLFSSFRDWFEVERVLLPVLQGQTNNLLNGPQVGAPSLSYNDSHEATNSEIGDQTRVEDDVQEVSYTVASDPVKEAKEEVGDKEKKQRETIDSGPDIRYSEAVSFNPHSWKLYSGLVLIFILVGLWVQKRNLAPVEQFNTNEASQTHLAMAIDINTEAKTINSVATATSLPKKVDEEPAPFVEGLKQVSAGNYAQASALFEKDLLLAKPDKVTWQAILHAYYRSENRLAYELKLRDYLKEHPQDALSWFNLGKVLYDRKELAQAASAIVKGLKIDPDNVRGNFLLGSLYIDLNLYEDAIEHLQHAVAFEPLNKDFLLALAQSLHKSQKFKEAAKYYQRVLSLDPENTQAKKAVKRLNFRDIVNKTGPQIVNPNTRPEEDQVVVIQGNKETKVMQISESEQEIKPTSTKVLFDKQEDKQDEEQKTSGKVLFTASQNGEIIPQDEEPADEEETKQISKAASLSNKKDEQKVPDYNPETVAVTTNNADKTKQQILVEQSSPAPVEQKVELSQNAGISSLEISKKEVNDESLMNSVAIETSGAKEAIEALRKSAFNEYAKGNWQQSLPLYLEYLKKKKDPRAYDVVSILFEKLNMKNAAFEAAEQAYNLGLRELPNLIRLGKLAEETLRYAKGKEFLQQALTKSPHRIDLRIRLARCQAKTGDLNQALTNLEAIKSDSSYSYAVKTRVESEIRQITKLQKN